MELHNYQKKKKNESKKAEHIFCPASYFRKKKEDKGGFGRGETKGTQERKGGDSKFDIMAKQKRRQRCGARKKIFLRGNWGPDFVWWCVLGVLDRWRGLKRKTTTRKKANIREKRVERHRGPISRKKPRAARGIHDSRACGFQKKKEMEKKGA